MKLSEEIQEAYYNDVDNMVGGGWAEEAAHLETENAALKREIAVAQDCINQYLDEDHQWHTEDITILAMAEAILRKALLTGGEDETE